MNAPVCKLSRSQPALFAGQTKLPAIPIATDLPSLIRAVNIMRDILHTLTTSLTVNNTGFPFIPPQNQYIMTAYPEWYQSDVETTPGFVYFKDKNGKDTDQRAYVMRLDMVEFTNPNRGEETFTWRYSKVLDSQYDDSKGLLPFKEDFFERIINVQWGEGLAVEFYDGAS